MAVSILSTHEAASLRRQAQKAHEECIADKAARDQRLAEACELVEEARAPWMELWDLLMDLPEVVEFLRSQMVKGGKPSDGNDLSDTTREEYERVSTGARPQSKPPFHLDAVDASDAEVAVYAQWAEYLGIEYVGDVWRKDGVPRGVINSDLRPAFSLSVNIRSALRSGWEPPIEMVEDAREVRYRNLKVWPELDVLMSRKVHERMVSDGDQFALI